MNEIVAFAAAVSHAFNIAKAIVETHDEQKLRDLKLEFTTSFLEVTQKQLAMTQAYQAHLDAHEKLKQQLAAYERWEQESQRYERHQPELGFVVYTLKAEHAAGEKPDWLCATCYSDRKASILHPSSKGSNTWQCPRNVEHTLDMEERM